MAGDASTVPLRAGPAAGRRLSVRARASELRVQRDVLVGGASLASIVLLSLLLVLVAANRPSLLAPTTHTGYYPRWMAGPLGGLLGGFTNSGTALRWLFTAVVIVMYASFAAAYKRAALLPVRWVVGAILAAHAIFLLSPPLALTDLFNYVNYARMEVVHGLNPYTTIPILEPHSDPAFLLSNWHQLLSPYGPLFTLITFAVVPLGVGGSFWALKSILMLASLATIALVWRCARLLGRDPLPAVVLTGLNPIVLVWGLGGDHNDFLMMFCIVLGFYLLLAARARNGGRGGEDETPAALATGPPAAAARGARAWLSPLSAHDVGAGAAFVAAVALKASAAVLIPVVLAGLLRAPRRLAHAVFGMLAGGVLVGGASLLAFGLHIPDLGSQSHLVTSESIPNLFGLAIGVGGVSAGVRAAMYASLIVSVIACCWIVWRPRRAAGRPPAAGEDGGVARAIAACGWASMALLVTLSWVLPWYVLWVLPLAAISGSRRLRVTALVFGVYLIAVWAPVSGSILHALDFHPERTQLGREHQRYTKELLN
jgi:hypothetical protein